MYSGNYQKKHKKTLNIGLTCLDRGCREAGLGGDWLDGRRWARLRPGRLGGAAGRVADCAGGPAWRVADCAGGPAGWSGWASVCYKMAYFLYIAPKIFIARASSPLFCSSAQRILLHSAAFFQNCSNFVLTPRQGDDFLLLFGEKRAFCNKRDGQRPATHVKKSGPH